MSARRPAPGRQVGAGSLRVDAARAVMKLRDYQLPEPEMWILELLRAGVTLGAEALRVSGDSDDVRVSWKGPAPDVDELTTLLDELVNPVADPKRRHLRLMATAVNTALGLAPRYIDIFVCAEHLTRRVRFTPEILEVDEDDPTAGAEKLRHLVAEEVEPPREAPSEGVVVHLRRFPSIGVLTTFVSGREPPELRLVRDSCDDTRVPIAIGNGVLERIRSDRDVLRIPLGPDLDGFMALMHASTRPDWPRPAIFEACERGVLLARHPIELGFSYYQAVPIRVSVDADRLPTNASRSEVRRADAPIAQAEKRAVEVVEDLVARVARELGPTPELEWSERGMADLTRSAFALLAAATGADDFRDRVPLLSAGPLAPLAELPLFRDAFGRPRTLDEVAQRRNGGQFVYRGEDALDESLEEWLDDLVWILPGDPAELLLAHAEIEDVSGRIAAAEQSRTARRRYLRYPVHDGRVAPGAEQLLSISLSQLPERVHATETSLSPAFFSRPALDGELCLTSFQGATVSYLYDGRLLARRRIDSSIGFEAVVSSPLLTPNQDFSGILDDHGAEAVDDALIGAAILAAEALCRRMNGDEDDEGTPRQRWVRSRKKLQASVEAHAILRSALAAHHRLFDVREIAGPLRVAPAFSVVTSGHDRRWASLEEILGSAEHGTFFTAEKGAVERDNPGLPADRLVVAGSSAELELLRAYLPNEARVVHYDGRELRVARDPETLAKELASLVGAAMAFERDEGFGAIGMTVTAPIVDIRHCGRVLHKGTDLVTTSPCWVVYEGPTLVPNERRNGVAAGPVPELFSPEERDLLRTISAHLVGEETPDLFIVPDLLDKQVVPMLLERLGAEGLGAILPGGIARRFSELPLFRVLGLDEPQSLSQLEVLHPGSLRFVGPDRRVEFEVAGFHPLLAPERLARAVAALIGRKARNAEGELERRRLKALRRGRLERHRERPAQPATAIDDARSVDVESKSSYVPMLRLSLRDDAREGSHMEVLIDDRPFCTLVWPEGPPTRVEVRARATVADETFESLSESARAAIDAAVASAVPALLAKIAEREAITLRVDVHARRLLDWWVDNRPESLEEGAEEMLAALGEAQLFDTVQGDRAGANDALRRTKVYVASYVGMWIGPDEGEASHSLDRPVLRVAEGPEGQRQVALIRGLTGHDAADVTKACEQLQARRRVAQGLVPKPTLHGHVGVTHVHDVSTLVGKDRRLRASLGPGEIGLGAGGASRVYIQRDGRFVGSVDVDVQPVVAVTLESPDVPRDPSKLEGYAPLADRVQKLADLLVRRLVSGETEELLDVRQRRRIRAAMLSGRVLSDYEEEDTLAFFETTAELWLTREALVEQRDRFGDVWYVPDFSCGDIALDTERHVFRMTHDEATYLLGDLLMLVDATEELRLDAEARRNLQRRPVERLELEYGEQRAAMSYEILKGKGDSGIEGIVAPLRPGLEAHRGMRLSRQRHPLGEHRDPCEWPTRAVVDAPHVEPDRTWSGANVDGEAYETLKREVRRASERALRSLVTIPFDALEPRRVGTSDARRAAVEVPVRGALWARRGEGPPTPVTVVDRGGIRQLRHGAAAPLPIEGRLYVDAPEHATAAEEVARVVYGRMLISLSRRVANEWDPVMAAHVVHGLATSVVKARDLPGEHAWPLGVARPIGPDVVERWLSGEHGIVWVVKADEVDAAKKTFASGTGGPTEENPWLVDDGSLAARALLVHLGRRAKRWPPEATPGVFPATLRVGDDPSDAGEGGGAREEPGGEVDEWDPVGFDEVAEVSVAAAAPRLGAHEKLKLDVAHHVGELLSVAGVNASVQVVPARRRSILRRDGAFYQLTARDPTVVAVQNAVAESDPRARTALAILTAHVIGEANRDHDDVTNEHEIDALVTLLGTGS